MVEPIVKMPPSSEVESLVKVAPFAEVEPAKVESPEPADFEKLVEPLAIAKIEIKHALISMRLLICTLLHRLCMGRRFPTQIQHRCACICPTHVDLHASRVL